MRKAFSISLILTAISLVIFPALAQINYGQSIPIPAGEENPNSLKLPRSNTVETGNQGAHPRPMTEIRREVKEKIKISDEEKDNYKKLSGDKKANIIRMLSAFSCSSMLVIDISDPRCAENPDLTVVSYYSFRFKDYGESPWTDISIVEEDIIAGNKWNTVGFLADLGEAAEFGKIDADNEDVKALWQIPAAATFKEKTEQKTELEKGITSGKLFLISKMKLQADHTYLLRTIGYRVEGGVSAFWSGFNWYNTDTIFAFKIAGMDSKRTVTILWKKILQKVAPILSEKEKGKGRS